MEGKIFKYVKNIGFIFKINFCMIIKIFNNIWETIKPNFLLKLIKLYKKKKILVLLLNEKI